MAGGKHGASIFAGWFAGEDVNPVRNSISQWSGRTESRTTAMKIRMDHPGSPGDYNRRVTGRKEQMNPSTLERAILRHSRSGSPSGMAPLHVVVLAAGQGKRMRSDLPKVLHLLAGRPLLSHVIDAAGGLGAHARRVWARWRGRARSHDHGRRRMGGAARAARHRSRRRAGDARHPRRYDGAGALR